MSNTKHINDGGPAFPCLPPNANPNAYAHFPSGMGMTLRDWFAGQALNGYLSTERTISAAIEGSEDNRLSFPSYLAQLSYETADAMIATRSQKP